MAGSNTFGRATSAVTSLDRLGDAVVELTADASKVNSEESGPITVYLAYAEAAQRQHYLALQVDHGTSLYEALAQAGWLAQFPELASWCEEVTDIAVPAAKRWHVGVYAQKQPLNYQLQPFDRVEVYRSLSADPMSQRKSKSRG